LICADPVNEGLLMRAHVNDGKLRRGLEVVGAVQLSASAIAILAFAYQGTFTRYMSDDYCDALIFHSHNVLQALLFRYLNISDRFSNILLVGIAEPFGVTGVRFLPALLIGLWLASLTWLAGEVRKTFSLTWPFILDLALSTLLVFVSLLAAPNRFQIFFWRSSMSTHFAPIVFLTTLLAFILQQARRAETTNLSRWGGPLTMLGAFVIGGFSEPPALVMIAAAGMALAALWIWGCHRRAARALTAWALAGAVLALLVMFLAPGNSIRLGSPPPPFPALVSRTLLYAFLFSLDTLKVVPLPCLFAALVPALLFFVLSLGQNGAVSAPNGTRRLWGLLLLAPLLLFVLITASFAPSVYGQSYPVARARFAGYFLEMAALMLEGALLGTLGPQWIRRLNSRRIGLVFALSLLGISAFYPLRAAWLTYRQSAQYREWAQAWDARDAMIRAGAAAGQRDLVVPGLSGVGYVKELDIRPGQWVNRCAAQYYGVDSISAPPFGP
jgi:hypothetical protein